MTYSHMAKATLPSAQNVFTSEFEMGSGGSRSLMPSGKKGIRTVLFRRLSHSTNDVNFQIAWITTSKNRLRLYGQASRAISTG